MGLRRELPSAAVETRLLNLSPAADLLGGKARNNAQNETSHRYWGKQGGGGFDINNLQAGYLNGEMFLTLMQDLVCVLDSLRLHL